MPPGDIRRAIVALSEDTGIVRKLFEYRFKAGNSITGHTIGNLLLTALTDITGNFEKGIQELSDMFHIRGKVIPVTLDDTQLGIIRITSGTHKHLSVVLNQLLQSFRRSVPRVAVQSHDNKERYP